MKDFLKTRQGILVIMTGALVVFVLTIIMLFGGRPSQQQTTGKTVKLENLSLPIEGNGAVFQNIDISGNLPEVPPEMEVYIRTDTIIGAEIKRALVEKFGFSGSEEINDGLSIWRDNQRILSYSASNNSLMYLDATGTLKKFESEDREGVMKISRQFLADKGLLEGLEFRELNYLDLENGEAESVDNFQKGNIAIISFGTRLNSYPVYSAYGQQIGESVWVGSDGNVHKASVLLGGITNSQKTVLTRPVSEVVPLISQGGGKIVNKIGKEKYVSLRVDKMELGYLLDLKSTVVQPIYIIQGKGFGVNDKIGEDLVIYVQAAKK